MKKISLLLLVFVLVGCSSGVKLNETVEMEDYSIKFDSSLFENVTDDDIYENRLELANENVEFTSTTLDKENNFFTDPTENLELDKLIEKMLALYTEFAPEKDTVKKTKIDGYDAYSFESARDYAVIIVTDDQLVVGLINTELDALPKLETKSLKETIKSIELNK